ncbi:MAG: hypothetical protein IJC00_03930, partial [Clostridia bacterium]|nr:hypothetical protein [Clostridia bacterium]
MKGKRHNLSLICFVLAFLLGIVSLAGCRRRLPYANRMIAAARLHEQAAALIREEKARRGVALAEEDVLGIGLLGCFLLIGKWFDLFITEPAAYLVLAALAIAALGV